MNYRHIYHAGNFADVLKHAILARIVVYLQKKERAFRVVDTHAGIGQYDLTSKEAQKTGEWTNGIGRLLGADLADPVAALLAPYLNAVKALNARMGSSDKLLHYPGSPKLVRDLLRKQDRLSVIELHKDDCKTLRRLFENDYQTRVIALDGWLALGAHLPPKEKRGLVLVDPAFEKDGEFDRMVDGLARAHSRWPSGTFCFWYPIKAGSPISDFHRKLKALGITRILCTELSVMGANETTGLCGTGLIIVNPPYTLESELKLMLPALEKCLAQSKKSASRLFWIAGE